MTGDGTFELDTDTSARFGALVAQGAQRDRSARARGSRPPGGSPATRGAACARARCSANESKRRVVRGRSKRSNARARSGKACLRPDPAIAEEIALQQALRGGVPPRRRTPRAARGDSEDGGAPRGIVHRRRAAHGPRRHAGSRLERAGRASGSRCGRRSMNSIRRWTRASQRPSRSCAGAPTSAAPPPNAR